MPVTMAAGFAGSHALPRRSDRRELERASCALRAAAGGAAGWSRRAGVSPTLLRRQAPAPAAPTARVRSMARARPRPPAAASAPVTKGPGLKAASRQRTLKRSRIGVSHTNQPASLQRTIVGVLVHSRGRHHGAKRFEIAIGGGHPPAPSRDCVHFAPYTTHERTSQHRRFLKMNGLGNEIIVLDLRGSTAPRQPRRKRAPSRRAAARVSTSSWCCTIRATPGTDAFMRIYNTDGSESGACGNGTRCVAWAMLTTRSSDPAARDACCSRRRPGCCRAARARTLSSRSTWARRGSRWDEIPLARAIRATRAASSFRSGPIDAPVLHTPVGRQHGQSRTRSSGSTTSQAYDLDAIGPLLENHPIFPERANISLAHVTLAAIISSCRSGSAAPA